MNQFVSRRSWVYLMLAWILVSALAADAFNLDDLIPGAIVLHDDDDCLSFTQLMTVGNHLQGASSPRHRTVSAKGTQSGTGSGNSHTILAIDEDSPSLANDPLGPVPMESVLCADDFVISETAATPSNPIHLLNCTLLI